MLSLMISIARCFDARIRAGREPMVVATSSAMEPLGTFLVALADLRECCRRLERAIQRIDAADIRQTAAEILPICARTVQTVQGLPLHTPVPYRRLARTVLNLAHQEICVVLECGVAQSGEVGLRWFLREIKVQLGLLIGSEGV